MSMRPIQKFFGKNLKTKKLYGRHTKVPMGAIQKSMGSIGTFVWRPYKKNPWRFGWPAKIFK